MRTSFVHLVMMLVMIVTLTTITLLWDKFTTSMRILSLIPIKCLHQPTRKLTQTLHDTGADDCTTNNSFILHDLHVLDLKDWFTLHDAKHNPPLSKHGGTAKWTLEDGSAKAFFMRYTPSMPVTVIDVTKMQSKGRTCVNEKECINHTDKILLICLEL